MIKKYNAIDSMKFIAAIMVIFMHTAPLNNQNYGFSDILFSISRIAVPFFFCTSGFFFFSKIEINQFENTIILKKYIVRILKLYIIWSIIMLPLSIFELRNYELSKGILIYIRNFLLLGSYFQLWYFPALIFGTVCIYFLYKKLALNQVMMLSIFLFSIGLMLNSYNFLLLNNDIINVATGFYKLVFNTSRNGLFYGVPFIGLGLYISKINKNFDFYKVIIGFLLSLCLLVLESYNLQIKNNGHLFDMAIMMMPTIYFLFIILSNIKLKDNNIFIFFRNSSTLIFVIHKIIIVVLSIYIENWITIFFFTVILSILISFCIIKLSYKIRTFKYLY